MADRFGGQIWIGGQVSRSKMSKTNTDEKLLDDLTGHINNECMSLDWGDSIAQQFKNEEQLLACLNNENHLNFKDDQARYGEFQELEDFLRENDIPYIRNSEAKYEHDAEEVWWFPGMEEADGRTINADGNATIPMESIKPAIEFLKAGHPECALGALQALENEPPTLPDFEVIE